MTILKVNEIVSVEVEVGMGATVGIGSDCYPATIVGVLPYKSGAKQGQIRSILVQWDDHKFNQETKDFDFSPNRDASILVFTQNKFGRWKCGGSYGLGIGHRRYYQDPSF